MPCTGRPFASRTSPSHWNPGGSAVKPRSISASTRRPDHEAGTSPVNRNHIVPHGGPHRRPTVNGASRSRVGPASTSSARRSGWTSGSTRSTSSLVIRASTSSRSSYMGDIFPERPGLTAPLAQQPGDRLGTRPTGSYMGDIFPERPGLTAPPAQQPGHGLGTRPTGSYMGDIFPERPGLTAPLAQQPGDRLGTRPTGSAA